MEKISQVRRYRLSATFLKYLFFFLFLILCSPYAGDAADLDLEKGLRNDLAQSKTVVEKMAKKLKSGSLTAAEVNQLKSLAENVKASHLLMQERFKSREEKVKALGSKAINRQRAMSEGYSQALTEYLSLLDGLPPSGQVSQKTVNNLKTLIDKIIPIKKRPIFGSLPYKHLNYTAKEPSTAPSIIPAYRGGNQNSTSDDLKSTAEAPISNEIATLAQSLNWNPVSIYEYVKNSIETEWYWGCMKGAEETLHQKSGNDCDQAALLTALLRASGFPTRYVRGAMEFFPNIERAKDLIGIDDPQKIAEFFQKTGIPFKTVLDGTTIKNIQIEHIWVESLIPYSNYRGAIMDDQGKTWLGLDTSIKAAGYTYNTPEDLLSEYSLSTSRDDYLSAAQTETPLEYIKTKINDYLALNHPGKTYADYLRTRTLNPEVMQILPGSMQFSQVKITNEYIQIPEELMHTIKFTASNPQLATDNELFTITLPAYKLSNQKIAITYEPETVEDQEIIDGYGGLDNTPSYLIRLRPVLKINDDRQVVGTDGLAMGADYDLNIELRVPGYEAAIEKITNTMIVGNLSVIGFSAQKTITLTAVPDEDKDAERILYEEAIKYIDRWNKAEDELASLMRLSIARPSPTVLMVGGVIDVTYLLDTPQGYTWKGAFIDADLRAIETVASEESRVKNFMQISSLQGSALENRIFEDDFQVGSISTAKLLQLANTQPSTNILTIDQSNIATVLPTLPFDQNIKDDITDAVNNKNLTVRIPQSEIAYENWTGIGYIKENPTTGESGWMLSGSIAGGMTAWSLDRWPTYYADRLTNPYSESPNYDPASATFIHKVTSTDMQDGTVGKKLATPLQVKVMDMQWKPVQNVNVTFTIKAGGGKFNNGSATITISTNRQGIASADLTRGQKTADNPVYVKKSETEKYTHQVGENIVDASLASGTTIDAPFTAYAFAGDPVKVRQTYGDGNGTAILSFSGFVSVSVEDQYGNPVSNLPVDFDAQQAVPNGTCEHPSQDTRTTAQLVKTNDTCLISAPVWDQCSTKNTHIAETTSSAGAAVEVIVGGIPSAEYPIKATCTDAKCIDQATFSTTFKHYTTAFGNCDGLWVPAAMLVLKTTETSDASGHIINAGKSGATIPVSAKIYYIKEGDTPKPYTYSCDGPDLVCDRIVGNQTYSIETTFTSASVSFSGHAGDPQGDGVYQANYTIKPGVNTITIAATADTTVKRTHNACPNYCTPPDQTTEPLSLSGSTTKTVYGVDITVNAIPTIFVDEQGYTQKDNEISYTISPAEYQALSASVEIYKNGSLIASIPTEKQGTGKATIARGFQFDINSTYQAEVVLNKGAGVEMRSGKVGLTITVLKVELVDSSDNPITTTQVGENENFVSWKTLEVKYKITPPLADTEYDWEVTKGTAVKIGHAGLGTPKPINPTDPNSQVPIVDKTNRLVKFMPGSTGSYKAKESTKAKPLAFVLSFKINGQVAKTFNIEQDNKNAIREEYKVYLPSDFTIDDLPTRADFSTPLKATYLRACAYDAADVPRGDNLNRLGQLLDDNAPGMYSITSSYRNPYRNSIVSGVKSSHMWSGAFDLQAANGTPDQLKQLWNKIQNISAFGQMYVESDIGKIRTFLEDYIITTLKKELVANSLKDISLPGYDPAKQYVIVWSKQLGWKKVTFSWTERAYDENNNPVDIVHPKPDDPISYKEHTFNPDTDWNGIAKNLHAQDKISDQWGFLP